MKKHYYLIVAMTFCFANILTAQQLPLLTNPVVSDLNYMMEITPIQQALPNLLKLRGVRYFWNPNANSKMKFSQVTQIGLVAQELEQEFSEIVFEDKATGAKTCLLYTSDAADERSSVDLGGRRIIKKKNK